MIPLLRTSPAFAPRNSATDIVDTLSAHAGRLRPARRLRLGMSTLLAMVMALSSVASVAAKDLSLPYRNYPGFTCNRWNAQGECTDFSYFEQNTSGNSYYGPSTSSPSYYYPGTYNYNTNCYDSYGRYDSRYCNNNYNYYNNYGYNGVSVRVTGAPNPVYGDDLLTYSIYLRNDGASDRTVDVRAMLDSRTIFHSASDRGQNYNRNDVIWSRMMIRRNSSKTLSLTVRVDDRYRSDNYRTSRNCYDSYGRYNTRYCNDYYDDDYDTLRMRVDAGGSSDETTNTLRSGSRSRSYDDCYDSYGRYNSRYCDNDYYDDYYYNDDYDDDCYDSRGRYDSRYCNTSSSYRDITLTADAVQDDVYENDTITYTIRLRNDSNRGQNVDLRAMLDRDTYFQSATDGGRRSGSYDVIWDNIYVSADSSRTVTVTARVSSSARSGDTLIFTAYAGGREDEVSTRVR